MWVFEKDFKFAESCVSDFIQAAELYHSKGWYNQDSRYLTMAFCFEFAARLSLSLGMKLPNDIISILTKLDTIVRSMHSQGETGRGVSDLIEVAARLSDDLRDKELRENKHVKELAEDILQVSNEIAKKWYEKKEFHWYRSYLSSSVQLSRFLGELDDAKLIRLKIAEAFEEESGPASSEIVRSHFLQKALDIYSDEGDSKKIAEVKKSIRESTVEMMKKGELHEISSPILKVDIQKWALLTVRAYAGLTPEQILERIVKNYKRFPDKQKVREFTEELRQEHGLSFIFPLTIIGRDLPEETITEEKDIFEFKVSQQFSLQSQSAEYKQAGILDELFRTLLSSGDLKEFLRKSKNITPNSMKLIETGIDYHFKKEYTSSIHILIPQVEEVIRRLLINKGKPASRYEPTTEGVQEILLGGLLDDATGILDENFLEYLRSRLTKKGAGSNIRNKVAHGWMEAERFTDTISWMLIDITLRLSAL